MGCSVLRPPGWTCWGAGHTSLWLPGREWNPLSPGPPWPRQGPGTFSSEAPTPGPTPACWPPPLPQLATSSSSSSSCRASFLLSAPSQDPSLSPAESMALPFLEEPQGPWGVGAVGKLRPRVWRSVSLTSLKLAQLGLCLRYTFGFLKYFTHRGKKSSAV